MRMIGKKSNYFIKDGYVSLDVMHTRDEHTGGNYWNDERLGMSYIYQAPVYNLIRRLLEKEEVRSVADVGCGVGTKISRIAGDFPSVEMYGFDQPSAIEQCKRLHSKGNWLAVDFDLAPEVSKRCDLVVCADVIEHVEHPEKLLQFISRVASDDGTIIISTPERDILRGKSNLKSPKKDHVREWNKEEFRALLEWGGFEIQEWYRAYNVVPAFNKFFILECWRQFKRFRSPRYNQIFVCRPN